MADETLFRALVALLAPAGLSDRELDTIVGRAEGNAFFVEELVGVHEILNRLAPVASGEAAGDAGGVR